MLINNLFIIYTLGSFFFTILLIKILTSNAKNIELIDSPGKHKIHYKAIPVIGGLAIFISFLFFFGIYLYLNFQIIIHNSSLIYVIISTCIIFLIGLYDDSKGLSTSKKIIFQFIASLFIVYGLGMQGLLVFDFINSYYLNLIILFVFIVGITNSINLIDGIDCLAGSISIMIIFSFIVLNMILGFQGKFNHLLLVILGSLLAFITYNRTLDRVFLGDSGSLFLGWTFSTISLLYIKYSVSSSPGLLPLIILGIPASDVLFVMKERFFSKKKSSLLDRIKLMFKPDNLHIHHLFIKSGYSTTRINFILCFITIIYLLLAMFTIRYKIDFKIPLFLVLLSVFLIRTILKKRIN